MTGTGRILHAQLHLLDRQLVDQSNGRLLGKVDDVELDLDSDPPVVAALIAGRERIPAPQVAEIDSAVKIVNQGLDLSRHDHWVREHIVNHIPGAGYAAE
jgi:sporulation protein YlmC with PRC-barrel domain